MPSRVSRKVSRPGSVLTRIGEALDAVLLIPLFVALCIPLGLVALGLSNIVYGNGHFWWLIPSGVALAVILMGVVKLWQSGSPVAAFLARLCLAGIALVVILFLQTPLGKAFLIWFNRFGE